MVTIVIGYLRLNDLGRPLQDNLDEDTEKNGHVCKILKKRIPDTGYGCARNGFANGKITRWPG